MDEKYLIDKDNSIGGKSCRLVSNLSDFGKTEIIWPFWQDIKEMYGFGPEDYRKQRWSNPDNVYKFLIENRDTEWYEKVVNSIRGENITFPHWFSHPLVSWAKINSRDIR